MKKKILLVSVDDILIRQSLSLVLRDDFTEVVCAVNGYEAFRNLRNQSFNLCFLDIHLPDLNSIDLMWTIKRLYPATKIIVMTGSTVDSDTMNAIWDYAVLRLVKPFDLYSAKALADDIIEKNIDGYQDYDAMVRRMVVEKRLHERKLLMPPVNYTVLINEDGDHDRHFADAFDRSMTGMGVRTNVLLEKGRIIRLQKHDEYIRGIVRWITSEARMKGYRAGIQFL